MKIHEYQAKALLAQFDIPIPRGGMATMPAQAKEIAAELGGKVVVKAQVHAGGRGRAGGIKVAESAEEAEQIARGMIGARLVTHQTSPQGVPVNAVLIEEAIDAQRELYLGILVDHKAALPIVMVSEAGGTEIEETARESPEKILSAHIDPALGLRPYQARRLAYGLALGQEQIKPATELITNLYRLFQAKDCSLAEINPLVIASDGRIIALDAKLNFDHNALFRHPDITDLRDPRQEDPLEVRARENGFGNYVKLEGDIGILVNGAGLAMSVIDALQRAGGRAANFVDGGRLNEPAGIVEAFRILTSDPEVKAVLVNVFGGIARVDVIATGVVEAVRQLELKLPVVVRLAGTNAAQAERTLNQSGANVIKASSFQEATDKVVAAAKTAGR